MTTLTRPLLEACPQNLGSVMAILQTIGHDVTREYWLDDKAVLILDSQAGALCAAHLIGGPALGDKYRTDNPPPGVPWEAAGWTISYQQP